MRHQAAHAVESRPHRRPSDALENAGTFRESVVSPCCARPRPQLSWRRRSRAARPRDRWEARAASRTGRGVGCPARTPAETRFGAEPDAPWRSAGRLLSSCPPSPSARRPSVAREISELSAARLPGCCKKRHLQGDRWRRNIRGLIPGGHPRGLLGSCRDAEALATLGASALQDVPTVLGGHSHEEAVRTLPASVVGLKRAFAFHDPWYPCNSRIMAEKT
jgi:hypothetical protein